MRIAIIQYQKSSFCEEIMLAVMRAGMEFVLWDGNAIVTNFLNECDGYVVCGSLPEEINSRLAAITIYHPIIRWLEQQSYLGKPILGIGFGAQILAEAGLVPGLEKNKLGLAMAYDKVEALFYENKYLKSVQDFQYNAFTRQLSEKNVLQITSNGFYFVIQPGLLFEMQAQGQVLFHYANSQRIAAVSNKSGNIMAVLPWLENADFIFQSMRDYIQNGYIEKVKPLYYQPRFTKIKEFHLNKNTDEFIISLNYLDTETQFIEATLHQLGYAISLKKYKHWEIEGETTQLDKLRLTKQLYDSSKEHIINALVKKPNQKSLLVHPYNGIHKSDNGISIRQSILWTLESDFDIEPILDELVRSSIFFNPYIDECYYY